MQFRKQVNRYQIFRYAGYDNEKKRSKVDLLGSIPLHSTTIDHVNVDLLDKLTPEERIELDAWLLGQKGSQVASNHQVAVRHLPTFIKRAVEGLQSGVPLENLDELKESIKILQKTLRKIQRAAS